MAKHLINVLGFPILFYPQLEFWHVTSKFTFIIVTVFSPNFLIVKVHWQLLCEEMYYTILYTLMLKHFWHIKKYIMKLVTYQIFTIYVLFMKYFFPQLHTKERGIFFKGKFTL